MVPIKQGSKPADLESWGTVDSLGATIVEGEARIAGKMVHGAPDSPVSCGYFSCTRSVFRMVYPFDEHAVVVEGAVTLTNEATGVSTRYEVGDSWFVTRGTPVTWRIETDSFTKNYLAVA
jgi:uncharacterized cupin superfamily protein